MKLFVLAALAATGACARVGGYEVYRDAEFGFALEVPASWAKETRPGSGRGPVVERRFVGDAQPQDEGEPLGAVLTVTRRASLPPGPPPPADRFGRDYEHGGPTPLHRVEATPMRVEGRVFRGRDAWFIVELRGARSKFDRYRPVLDRALASFRLAP